MMNEELPTFHALLSELSLTEYDVCLLIRLHFSPSELCTLTGISSAYATVIRKRLLKKVFGEEGKAKDFDKRVMLLH